jgi:hypothetical protein
MSTSLLISYIMALGYDIHCQFCGRNILTMRLYHSEYFLQDHILDSQPFFCAAKFCQLGKLFSLVKVLYLK